MMNYNGLSFEFKRWCLSEETRGAFTDIDMEKCTIKQLK